MTVADEVEAAGEPALRQVARVKPERDVQAREHAKHKGGAGARPCAQTLEAVTP